METAPFWPSSFTDWVTCVGGVLALIALFGVWKQLRNDGLAASANAINSAYNSISGLFKDLAEQSDDKSRRRVLREIFNQLETACALLRDGQFRGHSGRLATYFIRDLISMIVGDEDTKSEFYKASHDKTTFGNIRAVMKEFGMKDSPPLEPKQFMKNRSEVAEIVFRDYKDMQRATFELAGQYGRWLLASLLLIHGGALFGLFTFLSELADKPEALARYQWTVWWFVAGLMLTLFSGLCAWLNWSMNSNNYEAWANKAMLWDPDQWVGDDVHTWGVNFCYWAALILGVLSSLCIVGGAYSTLNGNWVQSVVATALV